MANALLTPFARPPLHPTPFSYSQWISTRPPIWPVPLSSISSLTPHPRLTSSTHSLVSATCSGPLLRLTPYPLWHTSVSHASRPQHPGTVGGTWVPPLRARDSSCYLQCLSSPLCAAQLVYVSSIPCHQSPAARHHSCFVIRFSTRAGIMLGMSGLQLNAKILPNQAANKRGGYGTLHAGITILVHASRENAR